MQATGVSPSPQCFVLDQGQIPEFEAHLIWHLQILLYSKELNHIQTPKSFFSCADSFEELAPNKIDIYHMRYNFRTCDQQNIA